MSTSKQIVITSSVNFNLFDKRTRKAINMALIKAARHLEGEAAGIVTDEKHNYTGTLTREITCENYEEPAEAGVNCFVRGGAAKYAQVIHDQRVHPAKRPPFKAIAAWVERKLGISKDAEEFYPIVQKIRSNIAKYGLKSIGMDGLQFFWRPLVAHHPTYLKWIWAFMKKIHEAGGKGKGK